ncbi:PsbQ-like domain superfamily [Sesbania bispinosa]|nr:PsbQ-like domain superfamily [Sesbania bispinosa]
MSSFTHATTLLHAHIKTKNRNTCKNNNNPLPHNNQSQAPFNAEQTQTVTNRRKLISTFLATSTAVLVGVNGSCTTPLALAQKWGTRSFLREHFFEPGLSPEDAVARIKQTAEGLHNMRDMLDAMSWRYVMFYIRLKQSYLDQDLKNALSTMPENRRKDYVKVANELVDNMAEVSLIYMLNS